LGDININASQLKPVLYKYHHSTRLYWKISWVCCRGIATIVKNIHYVHW